MKQSVGKVTPEERDAIQVLFERKNGLAELAKALPADNGVLYEKMVQDMGRTQTAFKKWWDDMSKKYAWKSIEGGNWEIDFDSCEVFLIEK